MISNYPYRLTTDHLLHHIADAEWKIVLLDQSYIHETWHRVKDLMPYMIDQLVIPGVEWIDDETFDLLGAPWMFTANRPARWFAVIVSVDGEEIPIFCQNIDGMVYPDPMNGTITIRGHTDHKGWLDVF